MAGITHTEPHLRILVVAERGTLEDLPVSGHGEAVCTFGAAHTGAEALALLSRLNFDAILVARASVELRDPTLLPSLHAAAPLSALVALQDPALPVTSPEREVCDVVLDRPCPRADIEHGVRRALELARRRGRVSRSSRPTLTAVDDSVPRAPLTFTPSGGTPSPLHLEVGAFRLDWTARSVRMGERILDLSEAEFRLLHCLLVRAGQVVDRDTLARATRVKQDGQYAATERQVTWYLHQIRRQVEPEAGSRRYLVSHRGVGYSLVPEGTDPRPPRGRSRTRRDP